MVSDFPLLSIREAASAAVVSPTHVYHIFNDDLHLKPLKFHLWHKLEDQNNEKGLNSPPPSVPLTARVNPSNTQYAVMRHILFKVVCEQSK
jgi:hypothetical protein